MPAYDYKCESCGHRFDAWQKITEDPIAECPVCGGPVHRILYPVGLVFKGSGFYINDSRGASNGMSGAEAGDGASAAEAKPSESAPAAEAKTESKTEAKSGAKGDAKSTAKPAEATPSKTPAASKASE